MPVLISMLRGVNVAGHNIIKMDALRSIIFMRFSLPQYSRRCSLSLDSSAYEELLVTCHCIL
jgi:hypothetical protein